MSKKLIFLTSFLLVLGLVCNASGQGTGTIMREVWSDIGGTAVSDLTGNALYPDNPTFGDELTLFETPTDFADNFGSRVYGWLHPATSGDYTFWIATDDDSDLYLSTDDDPANAVVICGVDGWCPARAFDGEAGAPGTRQMSAPVSLVGGQKYYIEAIYKEGGGGDNLAVAWQGPDSPERTVISGDYLSPVVRQAAWGSVPNNGAVDVKDTPVLTWLAGETAFQHDLYLSTDADLVAAGDASVLQGSLAEASFAVDVNEPLSRGATYYWKVDVSTGSSRASEFHPGNVWSFRVADKNTESWVAAATADSPAYLDTFVEDGLYDIGALSGDITYEFVVLSNPDETEASMALIGRRQFGDTQAGLKYEQWNNTGTYGATLFGVVDLDFGVPTAPGENTHLVFVSSEATNTTALYVNGALAGSVDSAITLSGLVGIGYGAQGEDMSGAFDNFDGTIFGVAIYDMALTDEQIAAHSDSYFNPVTEVIPVDPGTEGLVAYYAFENDANDSSGNEIHGTLVGDAGFAEGPAGYGMALNLDGDGDYVDCGLNPLLDITEQITFTYWIKAVALDKGWNTVLSRGDDSWRSSRAGTDNFMEAAVGGTSGNYLFGVTLVDDDKWHHVGAVYDGATFSFYVDGKLDSSEESTGSITISSYPLYIGNNSQNTDREWTGLIDEVMIYNKVLSDLEVMYLAGKRATPVDPGTDGLVAFFPLENYVLDASGNGNDGTIVGDPVFVEGPTGYGMAMEFDGDDHVDTGNLEDLAEWTIGCWAKSPVAPSGDSPSGPVHREQNYQFNWNHGDETFRSSVTVSAGGWFAASLGALEADTWYYLAGSYDGEVLKAYRDGELITANEDPSGPPAAESNSLKLARHAAAEQFFTGTVDEAIVYSKVLSTGEIRYLAGFRAMDNPGTDNLAAAYVFDADAADSSGNALDGTLLGDAHAADGVLVLDGDDDAVAIPGIGDGLTEFTFTMKVYPTVDQVPLQFSGGINTDSWGGGVHFKLNYGNVNVGVNGLAGGDVVGTSIIEPDIWTHLALTVSPDEVAVYVNGEKEGSRTGEVVPAVNVGAATIGAWNNGGTDVQREMTGMMDDVLFYNRALTEAEVRYLANN